MVSFPQCKINLGLRVVSKRQDGFHDIETCFYPLPWSDILEIIPNDTMSFTNTGILVPGRHEENLCLRAYYLLQEQFDLPSVAIHLHKIVPTGAGLGGGSSDAAYTLRILNELFNLKQSLNQLEVYASQLGSDCAFFIHDRPMIGTGRGEVLSSIDVSLHGKYIVVVKPDIHVSTSEAFKNIKLSQHNNSLEDSLKQKDVVDWEEVLINDFELSAFRQFPDIKKIKKDLYAKGALYASMSGSGSSVFGIFESAIDLREYFKGKIYWSGAL